MRVESRNRRVEITLDYVELRNLAASEGVAMPDLLRRFRDAGATSVALQEDTLYGMEDARRIAVVETGRARTVLRPEPALTPRIADALQAKTRLRFTQSASPGGDELIFEHPLSVIRGVGIGIDPEIAAEIRRADLHVVGRVANWDGVSPQGIRWALGQLRDEGASTVLFAGDEVLGFRGYVAAGQRPDETGVTTEEILREYDLHFGAIEFVTQRGDGLLARAVEDLTVRVHTVSGAEMVAATVPTNVQRFLLAARERNSRVLFVRLFAREAEPLAANLEYIERIALGLERDGLATGPAHGYHALSTSPVLRLLIGIGIGAAWFLLLETLAGGFTAGGGLLVRVAAIGGALLLPLLAAAPVMSGPKFAALAAACLFPSLALVRTNYLAEARSSPKVSAMAALLYALPRFLLICAVTVVGAFAVVGLLADRLFLIKADAFAGIKLSQVVPIFLVTLVYSLGLWSTAARQWPKVMDTARGKVEAVGREPILIWQVALSLFALVVLALLLARSGNEPGVAVTASELRLRSVLDQLFYARPRFKEFLIGHPALILALCLAAAGRVRWAFPLLIVGIIGQVSLFNTFCHLHTPLDVSLARALLGMVIGAIIGVAAFFVLHMLLRRVAQPEAASPATGDESSAARLVRAG